MLECVRSGSAHTFLPAQGGEAAYLSAGAGGGSATYTRRLQLQLTPPAAEGKSQHVSERFPG